MERIEVTSDMMSDFIAFTQQDGIELLSERQEHSRVIKVFNTEQEFILPKYDPLIYGKDETEHVVSIEPLEDGTIVIFKEKDGELTEEIRSFTPFVLSSRAFAEYSNLLTGKQHYRYKTNVSKDTSFPEFKKLLYKRGIDFWTSHDLKEQYMLESGLTYFKGLKPKEVSVLSFDIESTGLKRDGSAEVLLISNTYRDSFGRIQKRLFDIFDYDCSSEQMLDGWCQFVQERDPSVMLGHNIYNFDLKYMEHCAAENNLCIGRYGKSLEIEDRTSSKRKDGSQSYDYNRPKIFGRELVDTFFLSLDYDIGRKYESYGLKQIIKQEGLEKADRQHYDASKIKEIYYARLKRDTPELKAEWNKIRAYATDDADDALALYDLMIPAKFYSAQSVPKSFQSMIETATGSQINSLLIRDYLQFGKSIPKATETDYVEGGISFAVPGLYKNMIKVDLKSAYPSQILRFKLFDKQKDPEGIFYYVIKFFTNARFEYQRLGKETGDIYYKDLDATGKVFINSGYGVCQTPGLNFNCPHIAEKITEETRKVIDMALIWGTGKNTDYWMKLFKEKIGKSEDEADE